MEGRVSNMWEVGGTGRVRSGWDGCDTDRDCKLSDMIDIYSHTMTTQTNS